MTGDPDQSGRPQNNMRHVKVAALQPSAVVHVDEDSVVPVALYWLCFLALLVGIVTGLGAVVFRDLIGLVHNALFLGRLSFAYDASHFTPAAPWGVFVVLVPVVGGLGVTWLVSTFAPEARGHGVPEVMDAIYYKRGAIRPVVAVVKSLASALAIGSGAAVGREGPIIQIGSALGSTLGQVVQMTAGQRITLVAAGAGAGIAATFNTPIGGVLFATELMMPEISVNTFLPVAIATGTATFIGRLFFGAAPAFFVPAQLGAIPNQPGSAFTLILYALLGAVAGAAAALLIRALHWAEDAFDRVPGRYRRHTLGMLIVGVMMYLLFRFADHYYVEGVGYSTIQATLYGQLQGGAFLLMLALCKTVATSVSLGSGSSGGVFSPSLFIGATLGAAFAGRDGGRWHRCGHDRCRDDLRDDEGLRYRPADDYCGGIQSRCASASVAGKHLYVEACTAWSQDSQRAACEHVSRAERRPGDGNRRARARRPGAIQRSAWPP
jgi:CIC family chloride channel protein